MSGPDNRLMKILVVGSGGREHVIAWKLAQSRHRPQLFIAPGNAGTASLGENIPVKAMDLDGMVAAAKQRRADLVFVAPDDPLGAGMVDRMMNAGVRAFGPTAAAARIESSKVWAKQLLLKYRMPTAHAEFFDDPARAVLYEASRPPGSVVIKADGLAAGKGVFLPETYGDATETIEALLGRHSLGRAGDRILIEDRMYGPEVSVFAFVCGESVSAEVAACDYKRAHDDDIGPNTGGMGACSPPEFWTTELAARVRSEILIPAAAAMVNEGCSFKGVLFAGLMLTADGPKVVEFNARLGDPEAQVILPRLETDLVDICEAVIDGTLSRIPVRWGGRPHVGVVMASGGYPGKYQTGYPVTGINEAAKGALIFHAGTATSAGGQVTTNGGRVLTAVASADTIGGARRSAYNAVASISFTDAYYRHDIATRAGPAEESPRHRQTAGTKGGRRQ